MLPRLNTLTLALAVTWAAPLEAQVPDWVNQILIAANLPVSTAEARQEGASSGEIREILDILINEKVPAHEARDVIEEERAARRDHGPVDNFGAFVQARLRAGLRGRELAAAIRAEHAARGKGKPQDKDRDQDRDRPGGRADSMHRRPTDQPGNRPETQGQKPDDKGKPADRPRPTPNR